MKIIFITREGYRLPGARIRCYNFAAELSRLGLETEVLSFSDTLLALDGEKESQLGIRDKIKYNYLAFKKLSQQPNALFYLQRFNYHSFAPLCAHLLKKNRIILDLDDWEMRENPRYYFLYPTSKAHYFTRILARKSMFCVAASHFLKGFLSQFNKKVYYIPSGVDTELFSLSQRHDSNKEVVFSWIGTFHKKEYIENIEFAIDCFCSLRKKYNHIYIDIAGDGIYKQNLEDIVNFRNDSHIRLKGWIEPDKMPQYLSGVHVGLFPVVQDNKFNRSKSPTKIFEYFSTGLPVIASNIGEAKHIINDGEDGFLANSREKFILRMQDLIEDQALRQRIGNNASEKVQKSYSLKVLGKQLFNILEKNHA